MDPMTIALIVVLIGALLIIAEAISPGAFLIIPGTVLLIIGIVGYIVPDFITSIYSPILAIVIGIPISLITIKAYQMMAKPVPPETTVSESLVGKVGTVTVPTGPNSLKGKVRIGTDVWSAVSESVIEAGTEVVIVSAEGVHVKVALKEVE